MRQHDQPGGPRGQGGFGHVDRAADPQAFVGYLARASALEAVQAYKRQSLMLLQIGAGSHVLDVGCGRGDEVRALAAIVGPTGRAVGVDSSATMIAEARARAAGVDLPGEYYLGDVAALDFPDASFDACRADRVFQHLADPSRALAELVRVARPGAWVVIADPDWETMVVDHPDRALTRAILTANCDRPVCVNPWMGRQLAALLRRGGLVDVGVVPATVAFTDLPTARDILHLQTAADWAAETGMVAAQAAARWVQDLEATDREGRFFAALTGFLASGRKP